MPFDPQPAPAALPLLPDQARAYDGSASRLSRLWAALIDIAVIACIMLPVAFVFGFSFGDLKREFPGSLIGATPNALVWLAVNAVFLARNAQTVGKKLLGIQIVNVDDGKPAAFSRLVVSRFLPIFVVSQLPYVGDVLACLNLLFIFRKDRRCLHDHVAGTRVVDLV
jgi:uncharacterized RDD family membrane protein YckC